MLREREGERGGARWEGGCGNMYVCMYRNGIYLRANPIALHVVAAPGRKRRPRLGGGREDLNISVNPLLLFFIPLIATINTVAHSI